MDATPSQEYEKAMTTAEHHSWSHQSDANLLCAVARHDTNAMRELYSRHAPLVYALAQRIGLGDPDQRVEDAFVAIIRQAHCHARSHLDARTWVLLMAHRVFTRSTLHDT